MDDLPIARDDERIAYLAGEVVGTLSPPERAELDRLRFLLDDPAIWAEPDPELEDRIVARIGAAAAEEPATPRRGRARRWGPIGSIGAVLRRHPRLALSGMLAALVAILAVIVLLVFGGTPKQPLRLTMAVTGTSLAPGAHGTAKLTRTEAAWRIELRATGVPRLDGARYYEAWLANAAGDVVPVGTFNDARKVTLSSGVAATEFRSLKVTLQHAGRNPAVSGPTVLMGTVR